MYDATKYKIMSSASSLDSELDYVSTNFAPLSCKHNTQRRLYISICLTTVNVVQMDENAEIMTLADTNPVRWL